MNGSSPVVSRGVLLLLLALIVLGGCAYAWYAGWLSWDTQKSLPGTLVLSVSAPWNVSDGEVVSGLVQYTPATGAVTNLIRPDAKIFPVPSLLSSASGLSPDGTLFVGMRGSGTSMTLVTFSLALQNESAVLDTGPFSTLFFSPVWSADGKKIAYSKMQSSQDASRPNIYVAMADGTEKVAFSDYLIALSPDGSTVLSANESGIFMRAGDNSRDVTGLALRPATATSTPPDIVVSPAGQHLAVGYDGTFEIYTIDWDAAQLTRVGSVTALSVAFHGPRIVVSDSARADLYTIQKGALLKDATYVLTLSPGARILAWYP